MKENERKKRDIYGTATGQRQQHLLGMQEGGVERRKRSSDRYIMINERSSKQKTKDMRCLPNGKQGAILGSKYLIILNFNRIKLFSMLVAVKYLPF